MVTQAQNNLTQPITKSIDSSERLALNISTLTNESSQAIIVSPVVAKNNIPNRNHKIVIRVPTVETKVGPKQQRMHEIGDRSELTALTTGLGSQSEQHAPENKDKIKQKSRTSDGVRTIESLRAL